MELKKIYILKQLYMFIQALRMYIFNKLINRIPFACIRMPLIRLYVNIGNDSNILTNVEILNRSLKKNQIVIGNNSVINSYCLLDGRIGRICIGDNVDIARETNIFTLEHDLNSDFHDTKSGDVIIEDYVWISSRVTILPGVKIGKGAVVASNAVVTRNVAPMTIVGGIPAKKIGERKSKLTYIIKHFPFLS